VGADQHRDPLLARQARQQPDDLAAGAQVEVRKRLVEQQRSRIPCQRVSDQRAAAPSRLPTRASASPSAPTATSSSRTAPAREREGV
jgi:hypothetical protein